MSSPLFGSGKALIGVVHLLPLPGSPRWGGDMGPVLERARREAGILASEGAAGIIVENFGDAPFHPGSVGPETVAAMTLAVGAVTDTVDVSVGINVLRNDPRSAIAIAAATGAHFVRANVHYGAMVADEGLVQGAAHETLRYRRLLDVQERVKLFADVLVKHAVPLGADDAAHVARETVLRGLADALIVTGSATGVSASVEELKTVREAAPPGVPVLVGSGVDEDNAAALLEYSDGAIVGTSLKVDGIVSNPVDPQRVRELARRFRPLPGGDAA